MSASPPLDQAPIFLIGFMATGKSTVGRLLAERLGRVFLDLDQHIAERAGLAVPEIFRQWGERGFREREAQAVEAACARRGVVVACGGGAPCFGDNLARMREAGVVVALSASIDEVIRRALVPGAPERPLLQGREAAGKLYAERSAVYARADAVVVTDGRNLEQVTDEVGRRAALHLGHVVVSLGERSTPIHAAPLATVGALAAELLGTGQTPTKVAVISDDNVIAAGHAEAARAALAGAGLDALIVPMPAGEAHKRLATVEAVASACVRAGLDRRSAIVAVGGGVVGDLAGFVAATLFRGIAVAQVPTTLLAMIDSAIGGKTGVDLDAGKNLVGAFWQPRFVLAAPETLRTLPRRELVAAFGEVVKYALLAAPDWLDRVIVDAGPDELTELVLRCATIKAAVVSADELERTGARATLNLGHTVGHAIEAASFTRPAPLLHGEAVALGLVAAARVSVAAGVAEDPDLEAQVVAVNARLDLPHDLGPWLGDDVMAFFGADKKRVGKEVTFIAIEAPGRVRSVGLSPAQITGFLRSPGRR
jgi:shikimate kinase/3-dehydroquinate synthase